MAGHAHLSRAELEAIHAIGRGATELRMTSRTESRLLGLGLICRLRYGFTITDAGRRTAKRGIHDRP